MKIEVSQGIIHINSVSVVQKTSTGIYLYVDTKQKYPEILCVSEVSVMLSANERTLKVEDPNLPPTEIRIMNLPGRWRMLTEPGRYSIEILLVRPAKEGVFNHLTWWDDEQQAR